MQAGQGSNAGGWLRGNVYAASSDSGGFGTRRPSSLEAFCKGLEGAAQRFIIKLAYKWGLWRVCQKLRVRQDKCTN